MITRYRPDTDEECRSFEMIEDKEGDYVAYEDYEDLEEENRYLRAGCQDDTHQCPIVGTNNSLIERIAELEAENERLKREDERRAFNEHSVGGRQNHGGERCGHDEAQKIRTGFGEHFGKGKPR
jgi:hypothetical protein